MTTITERPPAPKRVVVGALLLGLCVALLPTWDGLSYYEMLRDTGGTGFSTVVRASAGFAKVVIAAVLGVAIARALGGGTLSVRRSANRSPRRLIFAAAALLTLGYLAFTAASTALTRSEAINTWKICETWQPTALDKRLMAEDERSPRPRRPPSFDGPSLPNGDPCVLQSEQRSIDRPATLDDGVRQIVARFPDDRRRVLHASLGVLLGLALSALLLRAPRRSLVQAH